MIAKSSICLIGAGPVGSLMSIFLARRGFDVTVYERRPDMRRVDIPAGRSINLALANRGINALERVGLMNEIGKHLIPMRGRMIHDEAGNVSLQAYGNKAEEIIYSVSRGELNKTLMNVAESAGVRIAFNQRCERLDLAAKQLVLVDERCGEVREERYEAIIGADGSGSAVRKAIAAVTDGEVREDILGHGYKELAIPSGPNDCFIALFAHLAAPRGERGYRGLARTQRDSRRAGTSLQQLRRLLPLRGDFQGLRQRSCVGVMRPNLPAVQGR